MRAFWFSSNNRASLRRKQKACCETDPNLPLLFPACWPTLEETDREGGSWSENGKKRNDSAGKQTVDHCGAISAAERPQTRLFAWPCGSHFSWKEGHLSPNISHSDPPCSRGVGLRPSCCVCFLSARLLKGVKSPKQTPFCIFRWKQIHHTR